MRSVLTEERLRDELQLAVGQRTTRRGDRHDARVQRQPRATGIDSFSGNPL
jgi:hypothetical protein